MSYYCRYEAEFVALLTKMLFLHVGRIDVRDGKAKCLQSPGAQEAPEAPHSLHVNWIQYFD